eukprot:TRINITY_DN43728_c0_g1_i1.p1 TRINITY_DN43728_c0_g1~~TRINITY_DN43728_c0_g1_i1.p1  ORF type:complete len:156 (+),score=43.68 TRINITY_DN43728_c0_g1_i1:94-561(+)
MCIRDSQHAEYLELLFAHFDTSKNGIIELDEWMAGCTWLNERLPESQQIDDPRRMFELVDLNRSGGIDLNELFESFRVGDRESPALMVASPTSRKIGPFTASFATPRSPAMARAGSVGGRGRANTLDLSDVNFDEGTVFTTRKETALHSPSDPES